MTSELPGLSSHLLPELSGLSAHPPNMAARVIVLYRSQGHVHGRQVHENHPENHNPFTSLHLPAGWGTTPPSWTSSYRLHTSPGLERRERTTKRGGIPDPHDEERRTGSGRPAVAGAPGGKGKEASRGTSTRTGQSRARKGRAGPHALVPLPFHRRAPSPASAAASTPQAPSHRRRPPRSPCLRAA